MNSRADLPELATIQSKDSESRVCSSRSSLKKGGLRSVRPRPSQSWSSWQPQYVHRACVARFSSPFGRRYDWRAMAQNRESGAAASEWGHATARLIAVQLGTALTSKRSNECLLSGKRTVIKCAHSSTQSVGVTYKMLERLDQILGAFEEEDGSLRLVLLGPEKFKANLRPSRSSSSRDRVGLVSRRVFDQLGSVLGTIELGS